MKNKRSQNQNSQYLWNILLFFRRSIWIFSGACSQKITKVYHNWPGETWNQTNLHNILERYGYRIYYWCKHWFMSLVWDFYGWGAGVLPGKMSPAVRSKEGQLFAGYQCNNLVLLCATLHGDCKSQSVKGGSNGVNPGPMKHWLPFLILNNTNHIKIPENPF